jgi:hypothetical protein
VKKVERRLSAADKKALKKTGCFGFVIAVFHEEHVVKPYL